MKVLLIRGRAIDPAVNKVARTLAENGYDVKLLVWDRQHNLDAGGGEGYAVHTFRLKAPYDRATVLFYLPIWWMYELWFLLRNRCDVIHACDLDTLIPAILAKLVKRVRLCYTIYDFYANNLPDGRLQPVRRLIRRLVAGVERSGIRFTESLFLVDESRYEDVRGARIKKLAYTYNSPPDYYDPENELRGREGAETSVFYAGGLTDMRGLKYVMSAIARLDGVVLTIAGTGPAKDSVIRATRRCPRIQYLGQIPYEVVINRSLEADILFAFYDPMIPVSRFASPNKLFEAMMCGKPIIVSDGSSMADIVRKENCGLVVPYGDAKAIEAALLSLKNHPDLRQRLGQNGRRAYEQKYSWRIMERRLVDAYEQILSKS